MLNEIELKSNIERYLRDETDYAILIDGDWGTGKTFFIRKLFDRLQLENEHYSFKGSIYISLYGLDDISELEDEIVISVLKNSRKIDKVFKLRSLSKIVSIVNEKYKNVEDTLLSVIGELQDYSQYVFIIDDLERTTINFNNILGFIHRLSDYNGAKIIVIGNQSEINITRLSNNEELKSISDSLFEIKSVLRNSENQKSSDSESGTLVNQKWINKNDDYKLIKEKTFGHTYKFNPELGKIYNSFFNVYFKEEKVINVADIEQLTSKYNIVNLRTIKKAMNTYNFISGYLKDKETYEISNYELRLLVFEYILYYTHFANLVNHKSYIDDLVLGMPNSIMNNQRYFDYFVFLKKLVEEGTISSFNENLDLFFEHSSKMEKDLTMENIISKLQHFISYTDDEVVILIEELKEIISDNRFDPRHLFSLIEVIRTLKFYDYSFDENYIAIIKNKALSEVADYNEFYRRGRVSYNDENSDEIDNEINSFADTFNIVNGNFDTDYEDDWIINFADYCKNNRRLICSQGILSFVSIQRLSEWLLLASSNHINELRYLILGYPLFSDTNDKIKIKYNDDLIALKRTISILTREDKTGKIQIDLLKSNIDKLLKV